MTKLLLAMVSTVAFATACAAEREPAELEKSEGFAQPLRPQPEEGAGAGGSACICELRNYWWTSNVCTNPSELANPPSIGACETHCSNQASSLGCRVYESSVIPD